MRPLSTPDLTLHATALALSENDRAALHDLYIRGTPENTLRAYERDLLYITAWRMARFDERGLLWPEEDHVALCFVLDHCRDLSDAPDHDPARQVAEALIATGRRRHLTAPAPSTLDRRIASWRAFHRMRNLDSPFDAPLVKAARGKGRRAQGRVHAPKSAHPITRDVLEAMLVGCRASPSDPEGMRALRDRAVLMTGFGSGGRRRSELAGLRREDVTLTDYDKTGVVGLLLLETKTTRKGETPKLILKGRPARALAAWIEAGAITDGFLFRAVSKSGRVLERGLSPAGIGGIVKARLVSAGFPAAYASAHGLRAGFITQAALDGAPIQAAMRLSLHRSMAQAMRYYDDVEITENPATGLLG
ncbi:tyrosine-type recombinase/integrase [Pseudoruegeria sp. SK021]|uniref:tyrosine-type recombinase/integrase n=1 Tax=Pseudoruegeria sp. SK021 TaxID=1933035 RepID=UPI000A25415D|nr:tyrosine-type recombinase/integrase [Pseudoruegeria sp. SK021]OSP53428.1 integrase [Pseudoruegeria sp. SK021]